MSMWSVPHSGHVSVMVTVTDCWFLSLLHRPCTDTIAEQTVPIMITETMPMKTSAPACHKDVMGRCFNSSIWASFGKHTGTRALNDLS